MTLIDTARPHQPTEAPLAPRTSAQPSAAKPSAAKPSAAKPSAAKPSGAEADVTWTDEGTSVTWTDGGAGMAAAGLDARGGVRGRESTGATVTLRWARWARWARLAALAVGGFLLPWCVVLAMTLPHTVQARNWSVAWVGLDAAEAIAALATAVLLARADARASLAAAAAGVLLTIDAWFDVCTSAPGLDRALALAEAGFLELPLAAAAFWLGITLTRRLTPTR